MKIIYGVIAGLFILSLGLLVFKNKSQIVKTSPLPSSEPFAFQELTIPYLRNKAYQSKLGSLEKYEEYETYTSYLTNYNSDGLGINGLLTIPNGDNKKFPAIVFVHGYIAPTIYQTTEKYEDYVNYLARNGFVVFKIDLRGHGDSEGTSGGAYYSSDYIVDTLNAYAALQSSGFVNPNKIGLWGHSMAGNIVLRSLVAKTDIPAAVIWSGAGFTYSDLQKYGISDSSYRPPEIPTEHQKNRKEIFEKYGSFNDNSWFWKQVTPISYLSDFKGAIQLNAATDDDVVNIGYSRDLNAVLEKTQIPHELHEYPVGGHNIKGVYFDQAMQNTVDYYNKYLK